MKFYFEIFVSNDNNEISAKWSDKEEENLKNLRLMVTKDEYDSEKAKAQTAVIEIIKKLSNDFEEHYKPRKAFSVNFKAMESYRKRVEQELKEAVSHLFNQIKSEKQ